MNQSFESNPEQSRPAWVRWPLSILRILVGMVFLLGGVGKVVGVDQARQMLTSLVESGNAVGIYQSFLDSVVAPNDLLFILLVAIGELLLGTALVVGAKVRLAASAGLFMMLNFVLAKGIFGPSAVVDWVLITLLVLFLLSNAGRHLGLDGRKQ